VRLHRPEPHVHLAVLLPIHLPVDVHVKERSLGACHRPAVQALVKGTLSEMLGQ
jgi:hypothetical protein